MTDTQDKCDMPAMPLRLNPEALVKVPKADREAIDQVRTEVRHAPWYKRLMEGVMHHLAGEAAGIAIGTGLVVWGVVAPRSPVFPDPVCLVQMKAQGPAQRTTYRLIPCPPLEDI